MREMDDKERERNVIYLDFTRKGKPSNKRPPPSTNSAKPLKNDKIVAISGCRFNNGNFGDFKAA